MPREGDTEKKPGHRALGADTLRESEETVLQTFIAHSLETHREERVSHLVLSAALNKPKHRSQRLLCGSQTSSSTAVCKPVGNAGVYVLCGHANIWPGRHPAFINWRPTNKYFKGPPTL